MLTIGVFPNSKKARSQAVLERITDYVGGKDVKVVVPAEAGEIMQLPALTCSDTRLDEVDIVLTLGGDGTFMNVARTVAAKKLPVCGVNLGRLGFLTEVEVSEMEQALDALISGEYRIEERLMLEATVESDGKFLGNALALNDIVVTKSGYSRMIELNLAVNGVYTAKYPADGLIVATPTGATGYSLSAGGPFVEPNVHVMVLTPICSHTLFSRSLIVAEEDIVTVSLEATHADIVLSADGQNELWLKNNDKVTIRRAKDRARFIRFHGKSYFDILRHKLCRDDSCEE